MLPKLIVINNPIKCNWLIWKKKMKQHFRIDGAQSRKEWKRWNPLAGEKCNFGCTKGYALQLKTSCKLCQLKRFIFHSAILHLKDNLILCVKKWNKTWSFRKSQKKDKYEPKNDEKIVKTFFIFKKVINFLVKETKLKKYEEEKTKKSVQHEKAPSKRDSKRHLLEKRESF